MKSKTTSVSWQPIVYVTRNMIEPGSTVLRVTRSSHARHGPALITLTDLRLELLRSCLWFILWTLMRYLLTRSNVIQFLLFEMVLWFEFEIICCEKLVFFCIVKITYKIRLIVKPRWTERLAYWFRKIKSAFYILVFKFSKSFSSI